MIFYSILFYEGVRSPLPIKLNATNYSYSKGRTCGNRNRLREPDEDTKQTKSQAPLCFVPMWPTWCHPLLFG